MFIAVKDTVRLGFINDLVLYILMVVYSVVNRPGRTVCLTSAKDGKHGEKSYHPLGFAWDFDIIGDNFTKAEVRAIYVLLKQYDEFIDIEYEDTPGNEHLHIEYDLRRKQKKEKTTAPQGVQIQTNIKTEGSIMSATWKWLLNIVATILGPILKLVTKSFRDELVEWVQKKYAEALQTENPWDDFLFETIAGLFKIDLPS